MSSGWRWIVAGGSLCVLLTVWVLWGGNGPFHKGRSLCRWLILYESAEGSKKELARQAILSIGTNAIPYALDWMQENPKVVKGGWSIHEEERTCGQVAIWVFEILGPAARSAIPELTALANTNDLAAPHALSALSLIGPEGLPALLGVVTNNTAPWRRVALCTFLRLETNAAPAVPTLLACLDDSDRDIADLAFDIVLQTQVQSPAVLAALKAQAKSPDTLMRIKAIRGLSDYGTNGVTDLAKLLEDNDPHVRLRATNAFRRLARQAFTNAPSR